MRRRYTQRGTAGAGAGNAWALRGARVRNGVALVLRSVAAAMPTVVVDVWWIGRPSSQLAALDQSFVL